MTDQIRKESQTVYRLWLGSERISNDQLGRYTA